MVLRPGRLRNRVTLQRRGDTKNDAGQKIDSWTDLGESMADITPIRGREFFQAQGDRAEITHKLSLRYQSNIALVPRDRVLFGTRKFNIHSVINVDERNREWLLMCVESLNTTDDG